MIRITSFLPPTLLRLHDKTYAVSGGTWIRVPENTTLEDVRRMWTPLDFKKKSPILKDKTWKIAGSKGNTYVVSIRNNMWNCTCTGFGFRRKCKHIDQLQSKKS